MALWPFGKNAKSEPEQPGAADEVASAAAPVTPEQDGPAAGASPDLDPVVIPHDAVGGETGPFDGDAVNINEFDFTDFSRVTLNLKSMRIPLPSESQVQVEMGETGPKMVHIVTPHGRATPVAFAAPRTGGLWESSSEEIAQGMRSEGMPVEFETGPWGREVVGTGHNGVIRIIGVEGPRWLYRLTLAAPAGREEELKALGRDIVARTFVYRGDEPVLAGNSLPVVLPQQLAAQVQQAVQQRDAQARAQQAAAQTPPAEADPNALSDALKKLMDNGGN